MSRGIDVSNKPYINPVKEEPMDDQRNDSGVTSGSSECPSVSPSSIRSSSPTYQFRPNNQYAAWSPSSGNQTLEPQSMDLTPKNDASKFDIESIRHPQLNSHGKVKTYKCKTCAFKSYTKEEHWKHIKIHIDKNKMLTCRACPFATHLKHHYEFHILSYHSGTKPFKCDHCDYACVNKSMLNSHLKSHSNIYPYRCGTCSYATKYLHTLKMHLQKTKHQQGTILNPDGTPNPYPIDVYGTRRGPKLKRQNSSPRSPLQSNGGTPPLDKPAPFEPPQGMHSFNPLLNQNQMMPFHLLPQTMYPGHVMAAHEMVMNLINRFTSNAAQSEQRPRSPDSQTGIEANGVLDLSSRSTKSSENGDDDDMTMAFDNVEVVHHMGDNNSAMKKENDSDSDDNVDVKEPSIFTCQHCSIDFKGESAEIMYRIHMGHHGFCKPYTCNICGEECGNVVQFTMHISKSAH